MRVFLAGFPGVNISDKKIQIQRKEILLLLFYVVLLSIVVKLHFIQNYSQSAVFGVFDVFLDNFRGDTYAQLFNSL